jgi:hypothetical protein
MELGDLYQLVLMLVLVGMILGVGILVLDKFSQTSGITSTANTSLVNTRDAIATVSTSWLTLIVTVAVLAIILTLVIRSFGGRK